MAIGEDANENALQLGLFALAPFLFMKIDWDRIGQVRKERRQQCSETHKRLRRNDIHFLHVEYSISDWLGSDPDNQQEHSALVQAMSVNTSLTSFKLEAASLIGRSLPSQMLQTLCPVWAMHPQLQHLNLSNNGISDEDLHFVTSSIMANSGRATIRSLCLQHNRISSLGLFSLAQSDRLSTLVRLDLAHNPHLGGDEETKIEGAGCCSAPFSLRLILTRAVNLQELNLSRTGLTDRILTGLFSPSPALPFNFSLKSLFLSQLLISTPITTPSSSPYPFSSPRRDLFQRLLTVLPALRYLDLSHTQLAQFNSDLMIGLAQGLSHHPNLCSLVLCSAGLTSDTIHFLAAGLATNSSLTQLDSPEANKKPLFSLGPEQIEWRLH